MEILLTEVKDQKPWSRDSSHLPEVVRDRGDVINLSFLEESLECRRKIRKAGL